MIYCSNRHGVLVVTKEHKPPPGVPDEAKVWIREDKMAKYTKLVNPGGPDWAQVCCRVTKDTRGEVLETTMIDHGVSPEDLKTRIEGPPRDILTEFWYVSANRSAIYNEAAEFIRAQTPGLAIADSGCRNAVGGTHWHHHYQKMLDEHQIPWSKIPEREVYKFGAGAPIVSHEACLYPVKIHGKMDIVRMSVVGEGGQACPGLIGPGELSRWGAVFRFADRKLELNGEARPMQLTATRHPGINLLEDAHRDTEELKKFWHSAQGQEKRDVLAKSPQTYAFLTKTEDQESSEEDEASSDPEEDGTLGGMEGREAKVGEWMSKLSQDLGIVEIPTVTTDKTSNTEEEAAQADSEEEATGDSDGSSSHELGVEILTEESSDEEQAEQETEERHAFISQHKKKEMHKSIRKKLGHCMNEIKSQYQDEGIKARTRKERICQKELARETVAPARPRKRWTVLEVFTWTCAISIAAAVSGWEVQEPVTLPRWNLLDEKDYNQALEYIHKVDPDLLVIAWPCTVWSPLQSFGKKTPMQRAVLAERRQEQRALLRFVRDAAHDQRKRGGALLGENPHPSLAWKEPLIEEAFEGQATTRCDMCQYGLKIPTGHIRKRTRLRGTEEILARCSRLCDGSHDHAPCLGGVKMEGKWMNVSDFAGGYTSKFAMEVVKGAEEYLQKGRRREVFVEGEQWAEEDLEDEEQEEDEEQQPQCDGEPGEDNHWKLQKVHERLGHPTNETLARMLSLSGATKAMVESAKNLQCPTCHEIAPPGRYMKQRVESRPTTFGTEVHVDLKYLHDVEGHLHVALSAIDAGTSFHMAVLLRNRNAEHVARKMARHWCSLHGIPQAMVLDQGGEFDGMFVGWMESHGIHSKVSGARSAWQHGFAERHGAVMGSACTALIWQYKAKGRQEVKDCLAAAIQAKNMTMTRKGYTPYQLAFGRHPMFPDLLDDEVANNLPLRDSMGIDGEVRRAAEMRAAARAVFMRQDVQDKLRRALKRWPRGEERSFEAGEMVYFYSPAPKATRFKKDGGSWRGPAVVLMRESAQRYFLSWRGRCLLVSAPNMRSASATEAQDYGERVEEVERLEDSMEKGDKVYEDLSGQQEAPKEEAKAGGWTGHDGTVTPHGIRSKERAREIAKSLRGMKTVRSVLKDKIKKTKKTETKPRRKESALAKMKVEIGPARSESAPKQKKKNGEAPAESESAPTQPTAAAAEEQQQQEAQARAEQALQQIDEKLQQALGGTGDFTTRLRKHLQDEVPMQFKKRSGEDAQLEEEDLRKRFKAGMFNFTMLSVLEERKRANTWASKAEVKKLARLLDLPVVSVKYHHMARKRFQKPPKGKKRGRITVMMGEEVGQAMVCHETAEDVRHRPQRKSPYPWKGMTLFVKEQEDKKEGLTYFEMPDGIYQAKVDDLKQWQQVTEEELDKQAYFEAFLLQNKINGKELDPRLFSEDERKKFQESDLKEWKSWLQNGVVKRLTEEETKKIDRKNVFPAPVRIVRVNKGAMQGVLHPKSRIVIPGHLDPHLGSFRSDAPTVPVGNSPARQDGRRQQKMAFSHL